jgi:hypothetical protein
MAHKIITLLTDFGLADPYVGVMKGVMIRLNPDLVFIDITHTIEPGDISRAGFRLFTAYKYFPSSTIHLVVVDPGVGSSRNPIIVETKDYYFVGPDNGVFSWIYAKEKIKVYKINLNLINPKKLSHTFHGRDVFAPISAELSLGTPAYELGEEINKWVKFEIPIPKITKNKIIGEVIDIDRFGSLITNISKTELYTIISGKQKFELKIKGERKEITICELKTCYEGKSPVLMSTPIAILGSAGFLEIALPNGNCAELLEAKIGTLLSIRKL